MTGKCEISENEWMKYLDQCYLPNVSENLICANSYLMIPKPEPFCYSYFWFLEAERQNDPARLWLITASFLAKLPNFRH